jgi:hypothetical protein
MDVHRHNVLLLHQMAVYQQIQDEQLALQVIRRRRLRNRKQRAYWVRPWLHAERRLLYGHYDRLLAELRMADQQSFFNYLRMPPEMFDELLHRLGPRITKEDTNCRKALEQGLKLAATMRHIASGNNYTTLQYQFRVAHSTCSVFIPEFCQALVDVLKDRVVSCTVTPEECRWILEETECSTCLCRH